MDDQSDRIVETGTGPTAEKVFKRLCQSGILLMGVAVLLVVVLIDHAADWAIARFVKDHWALVVVCILYTMMTLLPAHFNRDR
jgi:hypothetical protein